MMLDQKIEGLLFFKGEPMTVAEIAKLFAVDPAAVEEALAALDTKLEGRGLTLMRKESSVMLATNAELGPLFESIRKEELSKELSKASLETLSIVLYKGKAARSEIDYIRGVNSGFILRNLLIRGLVEKETDARDSRKYVYKPTFELLSYLGVKSTSELPDFAAIASALDEKETEAAALQSEQPAEEASQEEEEAVSA